MQLITHPSDSSGALICPFLMRLSAIKGYNFLSSWFGGVSVFQIRSQPFGDVRSLKRKRKEAMEGRLNIQIGIQQKSMPTCAK